MRPGKYDIRIYQGADFWLQLTWLDLDNNPVALSGYTARLQARIRPGAEEVIFALDTTDGIVLSDARPNIVLSRTAEQTAELFWDDAVYDLELINGAGVVTRLLMGKLILSLEVTR